MVFLYTSYTANRLVLKDEFLIKQKGTLGLFAPDPNQGPEDPGPATGDIALLRKADKLRLPRWGDGEFEGFWPKKARESSVGENTFSPTDDSLAFPGCKASGLAALPPGQKHHVTKPDSRVSPRISGNQAFFSNQAASAIEVQEMKSPGSGVQGVIISEKSTINHVPMPSPRRGRWAARNQE